MERVRVLAVAAALGLGAGVVLAACGADDKGADEVVEATDGTPGEEAEAASEPGTTGDRKAPKPDASFDLECEYFPMGLDSGLLASGFVENTGNVGIVTELKIKWEQLGAEPPIIHEQLIEVPTGERARVTVDIPTDRVLIDRLRAADSKCKANGKIIDSFGEPPLK